MTSVLVLLAALSQLNARPATDAFTEELSKLEASLSSEPDNLRYGNDYRRITVQAKAHDRCIKFFEKLVAENPTAANALFNLGLAYVDKMAVSGAITRVILAHYALRYFTKSIEQRPTLLALYTRGGSYLYFPRILGYAKLGVADLEMALQMKKEEKRRPYHAQIYMTLGDGYYIIDEFEKAKSTWREGLAEFPEDPELKARLARDGDELKAYVFAYLDPNKKIDTDLEEMWRDP